MDKEVAKVLDNIHTLRVNKKVSIIDLAAEAEISHSYLYYIETKQKVPTLTTLNKIAKALGVKMKDLFS